MTPIPRSPTSSVYSAIAVPRSSQRIGLGVISTSGESMRAMRAAGVWRIAFMGVGLAIGAPRSILSKCIPGADSSIPGDARHTRVSARLPAVAQLSTEPVGSDVSPMDRLSTSWIVATPERHAEERRALGSARRCTARYSMRERAVLSSRPPPAVLNERPQT